jgi:antitoxin component YwqK of YwqJK toxin-antitoxin module
MKQVLIIVLSIFFTTLHAQNPNNFSGKLRSTMRVFNEKGVLISEINYINGKPIGEYTYYYNDGTVMEQGEWNIHHQVGTLKRYDENGNIIQFFTFDRSGNRYGNQLYYYSTGTIKATKFIFENNEGANITRFSIDGKQKSYITL